MFAPGASAHGDVRVLFTIDASLVAESSAAGSAHAVDVSKWSWKATEEEVLLNCNMGFTVTAMHAEGGIHHITLRIADVNHCLQSSLTKKSLCAKHRHMATA